LETETDRIRRLGHLWGLAPHPENRQAAFTTRFGLSFESRIGRNKLKVPAFGRVELLCSLAGGKPPARLQVRAVHTLCHRKAWICAGERGGFDQDSEFNPGAGLSRRARLR